MTIPLHPVPMSQAPDARVDRTLTADDLTQIFPVPPSGRRTIAVFQTLGDEALRRDERRFYAELLERFRTDPSYLRQVAAGYPEANARKGKNVQKTLLQRLLRHLQSANVDLPPQQPDRTELMELVADRSSDLQEVASWIATVLEGGVDDMADRSEPEDDWRSKEAFDPEMRLASIAARLADAGPDPAALRTLAEDLTDLAKRVEAAEEAEERERVAAATAEAERRAAALDGLDPNRRARVPEGAPTERIEALVEAVAAEREASQAVEELKDRVEIARSEGGPVVKAARAARNAAEEHHDKCRDLLAEAETILVDERDVADSVEGETPPSTPAMAAPEIEARDEPESLVAPQDAQIAPPASKAPALEASVTEPAASDEAASNADTAPVEAAAGSVLDDMTAPDADAGGDASPEGHPLPEDDGEAPAEWTGRIAPEDVMARLLQDGHEGLALWLARLSDARDLTPALPTRALEVLALSRGPSAPWDPATHAMQDALAKAEGIAEAEEACAARVILVAGALRCALVTAQSFARAFLSRVRVDCAPLEWAQPVIHALAGLPPQAEAGVAELARIAGAQDARRTPALRDALLQWRETEMNAKSQHAPTNRVRQQIVGPDGQLGRLVDAVGAADAAAVEAEREWLRSIVDTTSADAIDRVVAEVEKSMNRPEKDRIQYAALDRLRRMMRRGGEQILAWLSADRDERGGDRSARMGPHVTRLVQALDALPPPPETDDPLLAAVGEVLRVRLIELRAALVGEDVPVSDGAEAQITAAALRLPPGAQPRDDGRADVHAEAAAFAALQKMEVEPEPRVALDAMIRAHALRPARKLFDELRSEMTNADAAQAEQELQAAYQRGREDAIARLDKLLVGVEPLQVIDLEADAEVAPVTTEAVALIARLRAGSVETPLEESDQGPDDLPGVARAIARLEEVRARVTARIADTQRERLEDIAAKSADEAVARAARDLADAVHDSDPLAMEDRISRLRDGYVPHEGSQTTAFDAFFPGLVVELNDLDPKRSQVSEALETGRALGPLRFDLLTQDELEGSRRLFANWRSLGGILERDDARPGRAIKEFLEALGFAEVEVEESRVLSGRRLHSIRITCQTLQLGPSDVFLPPTFGSRAGRPRASFNVFLASPKLADSQLLAQMARIGRNAPCLVLFAGMLTRNRRTAFGREMRTARQAALMLDDALLLHLLETADPLARFVACATPFGYLQPYITDAADVPPEMFFGREREIDLIEGRTADGSLIYGGRQLGKSALLNHVVRRFDDPAQGHRALRLEIGAYGTAVTPAAHLWPELVRQLRKVGIVIEGSDRGAVLDGIRAWLNEGTGRRLMVMFDEADIYLEAQARTGFADLRALKDLAETTERRFKIVFAGLHNVRRLTQAPNSPLAHMGAPICVGPLTGTDANVRAARRLVSDPMRAAGYVFEEEEMVPALLARVNSYPSLVQVYCKTFLGNLADKQGAEVPVKLSRSAFLDGRGDIDDAIRAKFHMTLDLDPRYELVAKIIALHRLSDGGGGGALGVEAILERVAPYWPAALEPMAAPELEPLLDEMVDLGVLVRPARGQYMLRGPQIARMLGEEDELERQVLEIADKEPKVDYDAARHRRRVTTPAGASYCVLTDHQMGRVLGRPQDAAARPTLVVAPPTLFGADVAEGLCAQFAVWDFNDAPLDPVRIGPGDVELRRALEGGVANRRIVVVDAAGLSAASVGKLAARPEVASGDVVVVAVGTEADARRLKRDVRLRRARPWGETMLRTWLAAEELERLDGGHAVRARLLALTGGAPAFLKRLRPELEALAARGSTDLDTLVEIAPTPAVLDELDLGLADRALLRDMVNLGLQAGSLAPSDLAELASVGSKTELSLAHLTALHLVEKAGKRGDEVRLSPLGNLVSRVAADA